MVTACAVFQAGVKMSDMRTRMRKAVLLAVLAGTLGFVVFDSARVEPAIRPSNTFSSDPHRVEVPAVPLALPERPQLGKLRTPLFASRSWQPPAPKIATAPPVPPAPPPMPYRYAGKVIEGGRQSVLLARGDRLFPINEGETLDGAYRVESIGETQVTLTYLPLALEERIPRDSSLPVAASATAAYATRLDIAAAAGGGQAAYATATPGREGRLPGVGNLPTEAGTRR